jgi:hypothetical protein
MNLAMWIAGGLIFGVAIYLELTYLYPTMIQTYHSPSTDRPLVAKIVDCRVQSMPCSSNKGSVDCFQASVVVGSSGCIIFLGTYTTAADAQFECSAFGSIGSNVTVFVNADDPSICSLAPRTEYRSNVGAIIVIVLIIFLEFVSVCYFVNPPQPSAVVAAVPIDPGPVPMPLPMPPPILRPQIETTALSNDEAA